jgi:cytochrome c oxidase subunit 3
MLIVTLVLAGAFLVNKYFEWGAKFHHGLYPGSELMQLLDRDHQPTGFPTQSYPVR